MNGVCVCAYDHVKVCAHTSCPEHSRGQRITVSSQVSPSTLRLRDLVIMLTKSLSYISIAPIKCQLVEEKVYLGL